MPREGSYRLVLDLKGRVVEFRRGKHGPTLLSTSAPVVLRDSTACDYAAKSVMAGWAKDSALCWVSPSIIQLAVSQAYCGRRCLLLLAVLTHAHAAHVLNKGVGLLYKARCLDRTGVRRSRIWGGFSLYLRLCLSLWLHIPGLLYASCAFFSVSVSDNVSAGMLASLSDQP